MVRSFFVKKCSKWSDNVQKLLHLGGLVIDSILLIIIVTAALFLSAGTQCAEAASMRKNILILNSYHKGLSWTDEQTEGIERTIKNSLYNCDISVEYMDWKNYPTNENLDNLHRYLKYKYQSKMINLVMATDDAALSFATKYRKEIFSNAPIVFSGVNQEGIRRMLSGVANVTGIIEKIDPEGTIEIALKMMPQTKQVYVLNDNTESGKSAGKLTAEAIHKINPRIKVITSHNESIEEIIQNVRQVPKNTILVITTFYSDRNKAVIGFENFCRLVTANSKVPVFDLYDFGLSNGVVGGSMLSGRMQGNEAGKLALQILEGKNIAAIPSVNVAAAQYKFDAVRLRQFHIPLKTVPMGSIIINKSISFFETYKELSITVFVVFAMLVSFIILLLYFLRKTTKMKQELKKSEQEYKTLFEKMLNGFIVYEIVVDENGKPIDLKVVHANRGVENQIPLKVEYIIGKTWKDVFGYGNKNLEAFQEIAHSGNSQQIETHYPLMGTWFLGNVFRVDDTHVGAVFDNITEYKIAIQEVQTLNADLERRVIQRTEDLQSAIDALEAFTYTVSHDLKSPVRAIDSYSRIVLEDFGEKLEADNVEIINNIRDICKGMIEMINQLLQYSTTSRTEIEKTKVDTKELFSSIFDKQMAVYQGRDIELIIETELPVVSADKFLMNQTITNLIGNAMKFTRNRSIAHIKVGCHVSEGEYLFYIKDNGDGFNMEYSGKLFGLFQRLHSTEEFEGNGIGLVTVRNIIQRHGGRVWIEGQVDVGASVYFTLPV